MRRRQWNKLSATLVFLVVIAALLLIVNPELRAIVLLIDALGLDLLTVLLLIQFKGLFYASLPAATQAVNSICAVAFCVGSGALRTYPRALTGLSIDKLVCPALLFITYGVRCRVANRSRLFFDERT
jgi:hypothetical protein